MAFVQYTVVPVDGPVRVEILRTLHAPSLTCVLNILEEVNVIAYDVI